jgi:hypothetical protein
MCEGIEWVIGLDLVAIGCELAEWVLMVEGSFVVLDGQVERSVT